MTGIAANLQGVRARIAQAAQAAGRSADTVALLAVSKTLPADAVRTAHAAGQRDFGENYVQEGLDKIEALRDLPLSWHFIGPLQSNKTRAVAQNFQWVHSIEREKIAERLSAQRDVHLPPLQVCVQVNVSGEASKNGVSPADLADLLPRVAAMPRLQLRGLMAIPEPTDDEDLLRQRFVSLRQLRDDMNARFGLGMDTLSMGMSGDLDVAIAEGATIVRVGTAIFGDRVVKREM